VQLPHAGKSQAWVQYNAPKNPGNDLRQCWEMLIFHIFTTHIGGKAARWPHTLPNPVPKWTMKNPCSLGMYGIILPINIGAKLVVTWPGKKPSFGGQDQQYGNDVVDVAEVNAGFENGESL